MLKVHIAPLKYIAWEILSDMSYLLLGGPLLVHWIWVRRSASFTSVNFSSCGQMHIKPTRSVHMKKINKIKNKNLPWESLWAGFRSFPQIPPESVLDRICLGRLDWPTPAALIPVMPTNKHIRMNIMPLLIFWGTHMLRVRWEGRYHASNCSLDAN